MGQERAGGDGGGLQGGEGGRGQGAAGGVGKEEVEAPLGGVGTFPMQKKKKIHKKNQQK